MSDQPTTRHHTATDVTETMHELISPICHRQPYRAGWRYPNRTGAVIREHVTDHEPLIAQLRAAIIDRADTQSGTRSGQVPITTLPRLSVDALDRMERIRVEVKEWCDNLGITSVSANAARLIITYLDVIDKTIDGTRMGNARTDRAVAVLHAVAKDIASAVEPDIARLSDAAATLDQENLNELGRDAQRWRTWCRIMAGWDEPALRPHLPCPACGVVAGERAGLRVRIGGAGGTGGMIGDAAVRAAVCLSCDRTWDGETIGLLAEQLRTIGNADPT